MITERKNTNGDFSWLLFDYKYTTQGAKILYEVLAYYYDKNKYPSLDELSEVLNVSRSTVKRFLSELQSLGLIIRKKGSLIVFADVEEKDVHYDTPLVDTFLEHYTRRYKKHPPFNKQYYEEILRNRLYSEGDIDAMAQEFFDVKNYHSEWDYKIQLFCSEGVLDILYARVR